MSDITRRFSRRSGQPLSGTWVSAVVLLGLLAPVIASAGGSAPQHEPHLGATTTATIVLRPSSISDAPAAAGRLVAHAITKLDLSTLAAGAFGDQDESTR